MKKFCVILLLMCVVSGCGSVENMFSFSMQESTQYQYHYEHLNEEEQNQYLRMYNAILQFKSKVVINTNEAMIRKLFLCVIDDHPELFWVDRTYAYTPLWIKNAYSIEFTYNTTKEEIVKKQEEIDKTSDAIIALASKETHPIDQINVVYDEIIQRVDYVEGSENNQNIQSVLIEDESVCGGYASAIQYILLKMGYECSVMEGKDRSNPNAEIGHAWNMVKVGADYFYLDATWGDIEKPRHSCKGYFMMTHKDMLDMYIPETNYEATNNLESNWFHQKNAYFDTWDESRFLALWKENSEYIEVKCNKENLDAIYNIVSDADLIFPMLEREGIYCKRYRLYVREKAGVIEIFVEL